MARTETDENLTETIRAYDAAPTDYARRYLASNFERLQLAFLAKLPPGRDPILDAGSGPGRDAAAFASAGQTTIALDLSQSFLEITRRSTEASAVRADLRQLPFESGVFRGVWMFASLVHLPPIGVHQALLEANRVLARDGVLFCTIAAGAGEEWRRDRHGNRRWFHYYSLDEMHALTKASGLLLLESCLQDGVISGTWIDIWATRGN